MSTGLVSIGIPAYARPRELDRAIRSVLDQGLDDVEVVVGDDSGDLEPVVTAINDDRVVYLRNETRLGMAGNWNSVLDHSRGDLVGLLMDDDALLPGFLSAVVERFADSPDLGMVFTNHEFSDDTRSWPRECDLAGGRYTDFLLPLLEHTPVAVSAAVMRRDVWERVRPLPDLLTADMVMHVRIAQAGYPVFYVDRPLMTYAVHSEQQSAASPRFRSDQVSAWQMFAFDDPRAERLRRAYLAHAQVSVGAADLREGRLADASHAFRQARKLGTAATGVRGMALSVLAQRPQLARRVLSTRQRLTQRR